MSRMSFTEACSRYPHRYTMEHVPAWALIPCGNGRHYAPHFKTDREWYDATLFPGEEGHPFSSAMRFTKKQRGDCYTSGQTWPLGHWLDAPYTRTTIKEEA